MGRSQYCLGFARYGVALDLWRHRSASQDAELIISDLRHVVELLAEFYGPQETSLWLYSKHRLLEGKRH